MQTRVWYGALQTGQNPNDIKDIDAVWDKARESRDLVKKYWESGAELMDLLSKEEIVVTEAWSGRIAKLQQQGFPIGYIDPPGGLAWMEDMLVLKGSPMAECEELLNFMLEPAVAIAVAEGQNYPPSLDPTKVPLSDKVKNLPAFDPTGTPEEPHLRRSGLLGAEVRRLGEAVGSHRQGRLDPIRAQGARRRRSAGAAALLHDPLQILRVTHDRSPNPPSNSDTVTLGYGDFVAVKDVDPHHREGLLRHPAGPVGLRQDDDPARDRRAGHIRPRAKS